MTSATIYRHHVNPAVTARVLYADDDTVRYVLLDDDGVAVSDVLNDHPANFGRRFPSAVLP